MNDRQAPPNRQRGASTRKTGNLSKFVPSLLLEHLQQDGGGSTTRKLSGAALLVDISGFSDLTEEFVEDGIEGAERLTQLLNTYFAKLIEHIHGHGGDAVDFSGDAILAYWPAGERSMQAAALSAASCALDLKTHADGYRVEPHGIDIRVKIGLGVGDGYTLTLGQRGRERKFALVGEPCEQMSSAIVQAQAGDIMLTGEMHKVLGADALCEPVTHGVARLLRLSAEGNEAAVRPTVATTAYTEQALRDFIVPAVLLPFDAGQEQWIADFRTISVLFFNLPGLSCADVQGRALFRAASESVLDVVEPLEGVVLQALQDDKGAVLEVVFGLPPLSHEDDALRAVIAGLRVQKAIAKLDVQFGMGLATGTIFCGTYGSSQRRHYAAVGSSVNLAARLMQKADNQVVCDRTTFLRASSARHRHGRPVGFAAQPPLRVKGASQPVEVFVPFEMEVDNGPNRLMSGDTLGFVGRELELTNIKQKLGDSRASVVLLQGEAGIGKSMLVTEVLWGAHQSGSVSVVAAADSVEHATPYYALREAFQELVGYDSDAPTAQMQEHLKGQLESAEQLAPLLNAVIPLGFEDTPTTAQMTGEVRADATRDLLLDLLTRRARKQELLLVVEDLHWLDSVSWEFVQAAAKINAPIGLLITTRPMTDEGQSGFGAFVARENVELMELTNLQPVQIGQLVASVLGAKTVSASLQNLVFVRSEGHPLFARELTYALQEAELIRVRGGRAALKEDAIGDTLPFPDTLQGVITSRLDRLDSSRSITLKVGSVIGRTFSVPVLDGVRPVIEGGEPLLEQLDGMAREKLLSAERSDTEDRYSFLHVLIREVAYNQLPYAQRRQFHERTASYIEERYGTGERHHFAQLAHHWQMAGNLERCLHFLDASSRQALLDGADKECIQFAERALEIADQAGASTVQRATWQQRIGEAHYNEGNIELSNEHVRQCLQLLGEKVPTNDRGMQRRALREIWVQLRHLVRRTAPKLTDSDRARLVVAANAYGTLGEQGYFHSDALMWFAMCLAGLNLSEDADAREAAGRAFGGMGYCMGIARLRPIAKRFFKEANSHQNARSWGSSYCAEGNWHIAFGRWQLAFDVLEGGIERSRAASDRFTLGFAYTILGQAYDYAGQFNRAAAVYQREREDAYKDGNPLYLSWALCDMAATRLAMGQLDAARELINEADPVVDGVDSFSRMRRVGVNALAQWMQGDRAGAHSSAVAALELARITPLFQSSFFWMIYGTSQTLVELYGAAEHGTTESDVLLPQAQEALAHFANLARVFPIMKSRYLQTSALLAAFQGNERQAIRLTRKALRLAEKYSMPFDQGLSNYLRARLLRMSGSLGKEHNTATAAAKEQLSSVGASWHLVQLAELE